MGWPLAVLGTAMALVLSGITVVPDAAAPATAVANAPATAAARPNIVLILTDDMRADELRLMPNVQRLLVRKGTSYTNAISPHPVCCPARAELLTGQFGQNNGVQNNKGPWGGYKALDQPDNTVAAWLQATGYLTAHHGKYLNGYRRVSSPHEPGWTRWDTQIGGEYSYDGRALFADGDRYEGDYIADVVRRRTNRVLTKFSRQAGPFFTFINHVAPHGAYHGGRWTLPRAERQYSDAYPDLLPPSYDDPAFQERNVRDLPSDLQQPPILTRTLIRMARARARALRSVDDAVARTIRRLRALGELRNTYVVFTSDNGFQIGEHRQVGKNLPFDESFDIPLVIRGPGIPAGERIHEPVTLVDMGATFLDWAGGVAPGRPLDGLPLRHIGRKHPRDTLLVQIGDSASDASDGWKYRGVTTRRYLFATHASNPNRGILFDRRRDPHATVNQFHRRAYAQVRRELMRRTRLLAVCSGQAECNQAFGALPEPG
ncbi:sulfatase-like hydrolase/transferase [Nocardioides sp. HM23]|uniref:sulfatase-like hydrolase/transferase n=1 Tax=Nocardioides bizhenqiangii TaxID=3095076 RepID=UPI002ACA36B9|nr:sulfatase-like hydrolase/transferase [Nocardioides sp. HM23]MDZ5622345.1 sulfatase-like hydrolase/transferase [Nocardioides sp. HM23]